MPATIGNCLAAVGAGDPSLLAGLTTLEEEFRAIKKSYFRRVLAVHPDKSGPGKDTAEEFRTVQASFEALRSIYERGSVGSFVLPEVRERTVEGYDGTYEEFATDGGDGARRTTPSWEYYQEAAQEDVPVYRVEVARSGRSRCAQKTKVGRKCTPEVDDDGKEIAALIGEGEVRIGWLDEQSGAYGGWVHLECWRVPSKVWLGLPDPDECDDPAQFEAALSGMNAVLLEGVNELSPEDRDEFVRHVMDRSNWAKLVKRKVDIVEKEEGSSSSTSSAAAAASSATSSSSAPSSSTAVAASAAAASSSSSAIVAVARERFVAPVPGVGKAKKNALAGKKVVLTGVFPELGGGTGLNLGKKKMEALIESFGGKVTGSVSGKTDFLVCGRDPGASKVKKARERPETCKLLSLVDLKGIIEGGKVEDVPALTISSFSAGYSGRNGSNSLALRMSAEELAIAAGTTVPQIANEAAKPSPPAKKKSGKKKKTTKKNKGKKRSADDDDDEDEEDGNKKPAAKKTKKAQAAEDKAAKKAEAARKKEERKAKAAADKARLDEAARKKEERHSTPIDEYDWRTDLAGGDLDKESIAFLKGILRHLGLALKGNKADLLKRLKAYAAKYPAGSSEASDGSDEEMDAEESEGENEMDVGNKTEEVAA